MKRDDLRHGTYAGALTHKREGKRACRACREAYNTYMRERRVRDPKIRKQVASENSARSRALWRLAHNHREEFATLVEEELR